MDTERRRWDARAWLVRVGVAAATVLLAPAVVEGTQVLSVALVVALVWLPLVSVTERLRLGQPSQVTGLAPVVVDTSVAVGLALTSLGALPLITVLPATLVPAVELTRPWRTALLLLVLGAQATTLAVLAPGDAAIASVLAADVAAVAAAALLIGETDRGRLRTRHLLDRAEAVTDAVLAGIGEAVVVTDGAGRVVSANDAATVTFGQTVAGPCHEALALRHGAGVLDCSRGCPLLDEHGAPAQADVVRAHPNGRRQSLLVNVRALRDPLGRVRQVVHSYRDVTSIKQADEAKTLFLATASHELKTPIAVIGGFAELLTRPELAEEHRIEMLDGIVRRSADLATIVDRLLLASRIEGGGFELSAGAIALAPVVRDRCEALATVTGRTIEVDLPAAMPPVSGESTAIATVVDHLVENAVKYSPDGGAVEVSAHVDRDAVHLDVTDTGVGMSAEDAEHCFEPFWQAEGSDVRRFGGSGIGLYIVAALLRAMGGEASVHMSAPGRGTTMRVTLAIADTDRSGGGTTPQDEEARSPVPELTRQVGLSGGPST